MKEAGSSGSVTSLSTYDFDGYEQDCFGSTPNAILAVAVTVAIANTELGWFEWRQTTPVQSRKFLGSVDNNESQSESESESESEIESD